MKYLRQSTASQSRVIGPFVDDTDGKTPETGLTIANTDVKIMVNGAASADKNSGGGTHRANGFYSLTFDATDTATVGEFTVSVKVAGALSVWEKFLVLEEAVFDALFAASATGYPSAVAIRTEMDSNSTKLAQLDAIESIVNATGNEVNDLWTDWADGGRLDLILDARASQTSVNDIPTNAELTTALGNGSWATAIPWNAAWDTEVQSEVNDGLVAFFTSAANLVDLIWDEAISGHLTAGSVGASLNAAGGAGDPWTTTLPGSYTGSQAGKILADVLADTDYIQPRIPAALVSGRMDVSVGAMANNVFTSSAMATSSRDAISQKLSGDIAGGLNNWPPAVVVLQAGLATPTNITAGTITTVTNLTNLPTIPANWITANGIASNAITDAKIASSAITSAKFAANAIDANAIADGAIDSGALAAGTVTKIQTGLATSAGLAIVDSVVDTILADIQEINVVIAKFETMIELDGIVWRYTVNALEQAPAGGGGGGSGATAKQVWDYFEASTGDDAVAKIVNAMSSPGSGMHLVTFTIKRTNGSTISGCDVNITTSSAGPNSSYIATSRTDANGVVQFYLDAGTYWGWKQKDGVQFSNPFNFTVDEEGEVEIL